jgi:tetratricopeptide (TPR) repeat protein
MVHPEFTAAIAAAKPRSSTWYRLAVSLQLLEWLVEPERSRNQLMRVRAAFPDLKPAPAVAPLRRVTDVLIRDKFEARPATIKAMGQWAEYLRKKARPKLASDVYRQAIALAPQNDPPVPVARYYRLLGRAYREAGDFDKSRRAYDAGLSAAKREGNPVEREMLNIALATVDRLQRLLSVAEVSLERVLAAAEPLGNQDLKARATHDAGVVAMEIAISTRDVSQCVTALCYLKDAWLLTANGAERNKLRIDIARILAFVNRTDLAREALAPVLANSSERFIFCEAVINEIHFAVLDRNHERFDAFRKQLKPRGLPAPLRALYWATVAEGFGAFGLDAAARRARLEAERIASRTKLGQVFEPPTRLLTSTIARLEEAITALCVCVGLHAHVSEYPGRDSNS